MPSTVNDMDEMVAMELPKPYADVGDQAKHRIVMESLAAETGRPFDDIFRRYEAALADIGQDARIRDFLPVFVAKRVKEQFRQEA